MSAKIYSGIENALPPKIDFENFQDYQKACDEYIEKVSKTAKEQNEGDLVGETIDFPVADGKAVYVVYSQKPLQLIHIDIMDGWHFEYAHLLNVREVRKKVRSQKALAKLFSK